jgi:hypothetical protein
MGSMDFALNGFSMKIYNKEPAMGTGWGGRGILVAYSPKVRGVFGFDVDGGAEGWRSRDVTRGRKQHTSPKMVLNEQTNTDMLHPEEPKKREISVLIALTPMMK